MEEKITNRLVAMGIFSMLVTVVLSIFVFHRAFGKQIERDMSVTASTIAAAYQYLPEDKDLSEFADEELRVTLIDDSGEVLFENEASGTLENHLSRPEVQQALVNGTGLVQRRSDTMGYDTYYYAMQLPDGKILRIAMDAENVYAIYDTAIPAMVFCCLVVLILSVVLSVLLTRQLVRPIERMSEHLDDIDDYVPYKELAPFAQAIHSDRLLRENNEKIRREFTANVSHELKTPLTGISGYAELIETGMAKPEDVPAFAGRIRTEAARLLALIGDIIQLTEMDGTRPSEMVQAEFTKVDLYHTAQQCTDALEMTARKAYVTLECQGEPTYVDGNESMLSDLCYNLTHNALRYNHPGGRVLVTVGTENGQPFLRVKDNGIGIPKDSRQRVFERFYRVDKSRSKATGGTGLGLAIVKHIALLHKAKINLESEEGKGTEITVIFAPAKMAGK